MIETTSNIKHRLILKTLYGCGLRVSEVVNLEKTDINFEESLIHIKLAKGKTIIMVTHSPELAHEHAEIIYWLKDGKVEKVTKKEGKRWVNVKAFKTPLDKRR